jgi:hypothetical protein
MTIFYEEMQNLNFEQLMRIFQKNNDSFLKLIRNLRQMSRVERHSTQKKIDIHPVIEKNAFLRDSHVMVWTTGCGDCLYNAISLLLFGNEKFMFLFRLISAFILIHKQDYFKEIISSFGSDKSYDQLIEDTVRKASWGENLNILSLSIALNRKIFVLTNTKFQHEYFVGLKEPKNESLILGLHEYHFNAFMPIINTNHVKSFSNFNQYRKFFPLNVEEDEI